ncbi:1000_t:CDS:2, partial [Diversispora eburnea]
ITELRKKFAEVETENIKLKQDKEKIKLRFVELEQKDKEKSILITKLQHDVSLIKEQSMRDKNTECHQTVIDTQNALSTKDILQSSINSNHFVSAFGNDTPEQTVLQCEDIPISNITDNTLNSNDTHEQIVSHNEESNISTHEELETSTFLIPTKTISLEEKEENEFLDSKYKEQVSKEIMERIRKKKLRDQDLSLVSHKKKGTDNLQQELFNTSLETSSQDHSLSKNIKPGQIEISEMARPEKNESVDDSVKCIVNSFDINKVS